MMINMTLETEKFKIACRAFFPKCEFSGLDGKGPNILMEETEYAPGKHAWAILLLNQLDEKSNRWVMLNKPIYKLVYEIDERSYATRENEVFFMNLKAFSNALKKLKRG